MRLEPPFICDTLPPEYMQRIGVVIFLWARLEYQMGVIAREAFKMTKETGRAMTIGMELSVLCGSIRTATLDAHWIESPALRKALADLAKNVKDDAPIRHQYAHGIYGYYEKKPNEFYRYLMKASSHRAKPSKERLTLENLEKEIAASRILLERAFDLTIQLKASKKKQA